MHVTKYSSTHPVARRSSGQLYEIEREGGRLLEENGGVLFFFLAMAENTRKERRSPDNREKMKKSAAACSMMCAHAVTKELVVQLVCTRLVQPSLSLA